MNWNSVVTRLSLMTGDTIWALAVLPKSMVLAVLMSAAATVLSVVAALIKARVQRAVSAAWTVVRTVEARVDWEHFSVTPDEHSWPRSSSPCATTKTER